MARAYRNLDQPRVSMDVLRDRILIRMSRHPDHQFGLASIGEIAFPGRRFGSRQGAALSVAKIIRSLVDDKLVRGAPWDGIGRAYGYAITPLGRHYAANKETTK